MNMPGFGAESSLGPMMGIYRGKAVSGRLGTGEVLPTQEFLASSTLSRNLDLPFLGSTVYVECCGRVRSPLGGTHPVCRNFPVLPFQNCECLMGPNGDLPDGFPSPPFCTPPVFKSF